MEGKSKEETSKREQNIETEQKTTDDAESVVTEESHEQVEDVAEKTEEATEKDAENAVAESDTVKIEQLANEIKQLTEEKEQLMDRLMRTQAEYENYKRRTQKERMNERKYEAENLAKELLPVLDNFERALLTEVTEENKSFHEGMEMIYTQLNEALKSQGIEPIETKDQMFDPNYHHAVMQTEDDNYESNMIVEELQKGYLLKDKVLRAAMVKVNK